MRAAFRIAMMMPLVIAGLQFAPVAAEVKVWEEVVDIPGYKLGPAEKNPMFFQHESYQGAHKRIYPYPLLDRVTNIREQQKLRLVFLENDYVKLSIAPDIGGRLFSAVDKTNNYNFFYQQHVIKPALIGMLGAWISGGIEWCVFHHHRNSTHMPVDYTMASNADGSKTVWFGEIERRHRMKWLIGVTLYPDRSYIEATVKMFNRTPFAHSVLYWANVATQVNQDYQVLFPPSVELAAYHAKNDFVTWPIGQGTYQGTDYTGVDLSWWKNHPEPISFFAWDLKDDFICGYDHGKHAGTMHVGSHHIMPSCKLWEWSPGPRGVAWDKMLTDTDGPYAELMVGGYSDNQPDYSWLEAGEVKTLIHHWYPIRDIGGAKNATTDAAVNLEVKGGKALLGFCATREIKKAKAVLCAGKSVVLSENLDINPAKPFVKQVAIPSKTDEGSLCAFLLSADGDTLVSYRPPHRDPNRKLPDPVKPPPRPEEIKTVEELYYTGLRLQQIYNPTLDPDLYYQEALKRDPDDSRTNTIVAQNLLQRGLFADARKHLDAALKRPADGYTRPRNAEAYFLLGLAQRFEGMLDEAYSNFYRAAWDQAYRPAAYTQLAQLSSLRGGRKKALEEINEALSVNALDTRGRDSRAAILRKLGRYDEARQAALLSLAVDPIDFFATNELCLSLKALGKDSDADKESKGLVKRMRDDVHSYMELAADYASLGLWDDAIAVLQRPVEAKTPFASTYPLLHYTLAYYHQKKGEGIQAKKIFAQASKLPADFCSPYRLEEIPVLEAAMIANPQDARAPYYLGNLLFDIQPDRAIDSWRKAVQLDNSLAIAHRNLGWAYYRHLHDIPKAIEAYEKAVAADPSEARVFEELDKLYEMGNISVQKRLALLEKNHAVVASLGHSFSREINVNVLVGNYDKAIGFLDSNYFNLREGGTGVHSLHVDAHLLRGLKALASKNLDDANKDFLRAAEYPDNHCLGAPRRDRRMPQIAFYTGLAFEASGDAKKAAEYFQRSVKEKIDTTWFDAAYYQALSQSKLGATDKAQKAYDLLIQQGSALLAKEHTVDFFAKFGEQQTEQAQKAWAHYVKALGYLGKGEKQKAQEDLEKSAALDVSNVWVQYELGRQL